MARVWAWTVVVMVGVVAAAAAAGGTGQDSEGGSDAPRPRRAPSGFLGMRGKKEAPSPPLHAAPAHEDLLPALYQLDVPLRGKKTPSGFLGMRGKKNDEEEEEEEQEEEEAVFGRPAFDSDFDMYKRTPSGFVGMRGKKAPSGFLGMRGKKSSVEEYYPAPSAPRQALLSLLQGQEMLDAASPRDDDYYYYYFNPEAWRAASTHKRAPSGFLGMRGKKDTYPALPTQDKRTPSGFLGMRG